MTVRVIIDAVEARAHVDFKRIACQQSVVRFADVPQFIEGSGKTYIVDQAGSEPGRREWVNR
jgi:hypothetical protein